MVVCCDNILARPAVNGDTDSYRENFE